MNRCVNIDWLEVYCLEPQDISGNAVIDADYLRNLSFIVTKREYGTPLYHEVLFVATQDNPDIPFVEVRRKPRLDASGNCVIHVASCHIRLTNIMCYSPFPIVGLCGFLLTAGYIFKSIKRIDICLDFNFFDDGENPAYVLRDFMTEKLSKINQSKVSAHGADEWDGRFWNSIKWGSPSSNITTKMYNKSLEMKQTNPKTYIQDSWKDSGLRLDIPVWRVEFSLKAGSRGFLNVKTQEFHKMKLSQFDSRSKLLFVFHSLSSKYFHFKYREKNYDGTFKRKDRCRDKVLFNISIGEKIYEPKTFRGEKDPTRIFRILRDRCFDISVDDKVDKGVREAAEIVAMHFHAKTFGYIM